MKIAICLHGLASGTNDKGDSVSFNTGINSLKEHVCKHYDTDIFFHTWSTQSESELINTYQPKKYVTEPQIEFDGGSKSKKHMVFSRWYSFAKSIELMSKTRKKYDFVLSCRFDLVFLSKFLNFENFCKEDFYITHWWQNICKYGYNDPWFVCNKENMKKMSTIYDKLENYLSDGSDYEKYIMSLSEVSPGEPPLLSHKLSSHSLLRWHTQQTQNKIQFVGLEYETWKLERKEHQKNPHYATINFSLTDPMPE
jgi:hypothetical protein|tara:strand:+ start:6998 stop:7756 length:759 start_codon:yes stop_codon:yes gene_type:complete